MLESIDSTIRTTGRRAIHRWSRLRRPLLVGRDLWARGYVAARSAWNDLRFEAPIDPYRILRVDPGRIERVPRVFPGPKYRYAGAVAGGDWDRTDRRFADLDVCRAYERHFEEGAPWQDTEFYDRVTAEIANGEVRWDCSTREEFDRRCERLDRLYERIRDHGVLSQAELARSGIDDPIGGRQRLKTERFKHEITIHVGREGELLFADGRNRLAIAKVLDLDEVPVRVLVRHRDWQATRDDYVSASVTDPELDDHPDVTYLSPAGDRPVATDG